MRGLAPLLTTATAFSYCEPKNHSFLQKPTTDVGAPYDGYFQVGCFVDDSPEDVHTYYKASLTKDGKTPEKVTPTVCFNFCRSHTTSTFFGVFPKGGGTECYCTKYPTLSAGAGGQKGCTAQCDGDKSMFCGSDNGKMTIFEMHRCNDAAEQATKEKDSAKSVMDDADDIVKIGEKVVDASTEVGKKVNIADARALIFKEIKLLNQGVHDVKNARAAIDEAYTALETTIPKVTGAGATADALSDLDAKQAAVAALRLKLEDIVKTAKSWWNLHSLKAVITDAGLLKTVESADNKLSPDWKVVPVGVKAGDFKGYLTVGEPLGTPFFTMLDDADLAAKMCFEVCQITNGCAAANFLHKAGGGLCNLKKTVTQVQFLKEVDAGHTINGFINNIYYGLNKDKIKWNTANMIKGE